MCPLPAINYLLVGHVALDLDDSQARLGGTVSYAGLTAQHLGCQVGIVTRCRPDLDCSALDAMTGFHRLDSQITTTFENRYVSGQRQQLAHQVSEPISLDDIPKQWHNADIVHLAPIMDELDPSLIGELHARFKGVTAQGWLRKREDGDQVHISDWTKLKPYLPDADAVIVSQEDLNGDLDQASQMARFCRLVVVTQGESGAMIYWCGRRKQFPAPSAKQREPTGAGDIFAAVFFTQMAGGSTAWEAAEYANKIAADSVERQGLESVPSTAHLRAIDKGKQP
jgi:sugar/nucleoside kinase (ribokinase family)